MRLLNLTESTYQTYRLNVRGNETISFEQAQKKLTRNVLLAVEKRRLKNFIRFQQQYIYGCLRITVRFGTIIKIENHIQDTIPGWVCDQQRYEEISKQLGIYENKFKRDIKKRKFIY